MKSEKELFELNLLILAAIDGSINADDARRLNELIATDAAATDYYAEFMGIYVALRQPGQISTIFAHGAADNSERIDFELLQSLALSEMVAEATEMEEPVRRVSPPLVNVARAQIPSKLSILKLAGGIAALIAMTFILISIERKVNNEMGRSIERTIVATITNSINAQWNESLASDDILRYKELALLDGLVEIRFGRGAAVVVEAPAEIAFESNNGLYLKSGKISATVPLSAKGFTVNLDNAQIIDIGTEFAVKAEADGHSELYVFKGEVDLAAGWQGTAQNVQKKVLAGQAWRVNNSTGILQELDCRQDLFVRSMPSLYEYAVRQSRPVSYWQLDSSAGYKLVNQMDWQAGRGTLVGDVKVEDADIVPGMLEKVKAMKFDGGDSHLVLDELPASNTHSKSYTIALWLKIDDVDEYNILVFTSKQGQFLDFSRQLRLNSDGQLEYYVFRDKPQGMTSDYEGLVHRGDRKLGAGVWYHIAVSIDDENYMRFFVNGQQDGPTLLTGNPVAMYEILKVGCAAGKKVRGFNHNLDIVDHSRGALCGAIAELALYDRGLTADEVLKLYQAAHKGEMAEIGN